MLCRQVLDWYGLARPILELGYSQILYCEYVRIFFTQNKLNLIVVDTQIPREMFNYLERVLWKRMLKEIVMLFKFFSVIVIV